MTTDSAGPDGALPDDELTVRLSSLDLKLHNKADADQVREAFTALIIDLEPLCVSYEQALREIDELRRQLTRAQQKSSRAATDEEQDQAVALLTQAQELADQLIGEANAQSRDVMLAARAYERLVVERAGTAAPLELRDTPEPNDEAARAIESYATLAKRQFYAVLDAMREAVDHLDDTPTTPTISPIETAADRTLRLQVADPRQIAPMTG